MRFAGELALFAAVFAGLGLVHLAERVDLAISLCELPLAPYHGIDATASGRSAGFSHVMTRSRAASSRAAKWDAAIPLS